MPNFFTRIRNIISGVVEAITGEEPTWGIDWEEEMQNSIDDARDIIMGYLEAYQPFGEKEESFEIYNKSGRRVYVRDGQFPSDRTGHTPISEGWETLTERHGDTLKLRFSNVSEHIWWVMGYADSSRRKIKSRWPEPIYSTKPLIFWWGAPTRWTAKDGKPSGPRIFDHVTREAPIANNFVDIAMRQARREVGSTIQQGFGDFLIEVIERRGGYRRR